MVKTENLKINTSGDCDIIDITTNIKSKIKKTNIKNGIVTIFVPGATGGLTTIEYESGLIEDLQELFDKIIPDSKTYKHNLKWHDGNGHSHIRASLIGPSLTVPFKNKNLTLGTWQQIIFIDFDVRNRTRNIILQIIGDQSPE